MWRTSLDWSGARDGLRGFAQLIHWMFRRPQVLGTFERLIEYINGHDGAKWATFEQDVDDFAKRCSPPAKLAPS